MVLHLVNDYSGSSVYKNLFNNLDDLGISQIVYTPVREKHRIGKNFIYFKQIDSEIIYRPILNYHIDRVLYHWKIKKIVKDIQSQVDFSKIKIIHAHTWYSDGGVAYELSKKFKIPYFITIRNTDVNLFYKKLKYLRPYGCDILSNARSVILVSGAYKGRILSLPSLQSISNTLNRKTITIPNGVDQFWIENAKFKFLKKQESTRFVYIGKFDPGKNIVNLSKAIISLNNQGFKCSLDLVGGTGKDEEVILSYVEKFPQIFNYHGKILDKNKLMSVLDSSDCFVMPSRNETFGLVYVEAMLQGLPILYTKDEGIDGYYSELIGEKVSKDAGEMEIEETLKTLINNLDSYQIPQKELLKNHNWRFIAEKYINIYNL